MHRQTFSRIWIQIWKQNGLCTASKSEFTINLNLDLANQTSPKISSVSIAILETYCNNYRVQFLSGHSVHTTRRSTAEMEVTTTNELLVIKTVIHSPLSMSFSSTHFTSIIASQVQNSIACIFLKTCSQTQPTIVHKILNCTCAAKTPVTTLRTVLSADQSISGWRSKITNTCKWPSDNDILHHDHIWHIKSILSSPSFLWKIFQENGSLFEKKDSSLWGHVLSIKHPWHGILPWHGCFMGKTLLRSVNHGNTN